MAEQEKEEGGEFHSLQRLGADMAAEGELRYANTTIKKVFTIRKSLCVSVNEQ